MKLRSRLVLFSSFIIGLCLVLFFPKPKKENSADPLQTTSLRRQSRALALEQKFLKSTRHPISTKTQNDYKNENEISCAELWNQLQIVDLEKVASGSDESTLPHALTCIPSDPTLKDLHNEYAKECAPLWSIQAKNQKPTAELLNKCISTAILYRAFANDFRTQNEEISSIDDRILLLDKLLSSLTIKKDFTKGLEIADRLLRLEPDLYLSAKAKVVATFMQSLAQNENQPSDWKKVEEALADAKDFGFADTDLIDLEFFLKTRGLQLSEGFRPLAQQIQNENKNLGIGEYYLSAIEWKLGNKDIAQDYLAQALKKEPENERYRTTLSEMKKVANSNDPSEAKIFSFSLGFSYKTPVTSQKENQQ